MHLNIPSILLLLFLRNTLSIFSPIEKNSDNDIELVFKS